METTPKMPSKKRRLEIYKGALVAIEKIIKNEGAYHLGLCYAMSRITTRSEPWPYEEMDMFPEIYKHKPNLFGQYWFPYTDEGDKIRVNILKQAIKELIPKKKKK